MTRLLASLALLAVLSILATGCTADTGEPATEFQQEDAVAIQPADGTEFEVVFLPNSEDAQSTDVYLQDPATNEMSFFGTISGVDVEWSIAHQYVNGHLYYAKRTGDDTSDEWTDELWRLDAQGQQVLLYASQGMSFVVAPTGEYIAVDYLISEETWQRGLAFLDAQGATLQSLTFGEVNADSVLSLEQWSDDGRVFWVGFYYGPRVFTFARISLPDWQSTLYDTAAFAPQAAEMALEANTGQLLYSDMPAHFDVVSAQEFFVSQQPVTLYLHNLDSGAYFSVATSAARAFNPKWLDDGRFAYDAPDSSGRATYQVLSGEVTVEPWPETGAVYPAALPSGFEDVMPALEGTGVAVMLPASFPVDGDLATYPYVYTAMEGKYEISLDYVADCQGAGACRYGTLVARRIGAIGEAFDTIMPFWDASVSDMPQLIGNIPSYFVDYECGANCGDAKLFWIYGDCEYMLGLKAGSKEALVELANAMLANSIP